ncbi:ArnT family glycosyltransferase [Sphingomonas sp. Tas61C01]|uniref:ArnT family glycosyltransferase n=1 Tax=Sphingomonas sp. Tas61C01 TaxID=3458297 RepID=UPI00403E415F
MPALPLDTRYEPARTGPRGYVVRTEVLVAVVSLLLAATFLFVDRATMPIRLWDESRNIVNALEMHRAGIGLVTTYGGAPDLWNSKPPLLIWLMAASVDAFGPSLWALRLPSMVAGLATIALVFWFVRRVSGSASTAWLGAALMVASPAYFGEHSARTADYDAALLFFVTAYACLLFLAVHRRCPSWWLLGAAGAAICCACLTKSVAGLVPGAGVALYVLLAGRRRRLVASSHYVVAGAAVLAVAIGFLVLRETRSPGYLPAIWANDVGGRFASSLVLPKPWTYYLGLLRAGYFAATPLLLLAPVAWVFARGRQRVLLGFALCMVASILAVFSLAASKLDHYILTALPFMAIAAAITVRVATDRARAVLAGGGRHSRVAAATLMLVATVPLLTGAAAAVARRYYLPPVGEGAEAGRYGALFAAIAPRIDAPIVVVDPGFSYDGWPHYAPTLLAYRELWLARGVPIGHRVALARPTSTALVASCAPSVVARLLRSGRDEAGVAGCAAVRMAPRLLPPRSSGA